MDYQYLQGLGLDGPLTEERNLCGSTSGFGSFQHSAYDPPFPPLSWSASDTNLLQMNEHAWLKRVKIPPAANLGVDTSGDFTHQRPNPIKHNSEFPIRSDIMMAAICDSFPFYVDVAARAQWMQMCSLSSDDNSNDVMPQLVSDSVAQQPCMYTSSSDCLHEADSSGSSERDRPLSRSCLGGSSSDEINWRNSDVLQGNLGGSLIGFPLDGLPDESSSVAADLDTLDSRSHALSSLVVSMPGPAVEYLPLGPISWMSPSTIESGNGSMVTSIVNQLIPSSDPFGVSLSTHSNGAPPYKRHRASYTLENMSTRPSSQPPNPSLSKSIPTRSPGSDYPTTSLNMTNVLYKDFHVSRRQTLSLPKAGVYEAVGGLATRRDQLDNDPRSHRKQNATSIEPQSVAARHRRKKISERVRVLEKLIPGGNKMDTASMLDESIEYVKFLQLQVQLLESLGDVSEGSSIASTPSSYKDTEGGLEGFDTRTGSFGSHASQGCTTMQQVRPAASPLILSEILQQQLFKQKLCLVALRQCPPATRCSASGTYT